MWGCHTLQRTIALNKESLIIKNTKKRKAGCLSMSKNIVCNATIIASIVFGLFVYGANAVPCELSRVSADTIVGSGCDRCCTEDETCAGCNYGYSWCNWDDCSSMHTKFIKQAKSGCEKDDDCSNNDSNKCEL